VFRNQYGRLGARDTSHDCFISSRRLHHSHEHILSALKRRSQVEEKTTNAGAKTKKTPEAEGVSDFIYFIIFLLWNSIQCCIRPYCPVWTIVTMYSLMFFLCLMSMANKDSFIHLFIHFKMSVGFVFFSQ